MEHHGFRVTFDGKIYFIVSFRKGSHLLTRQAQHDYLSAFIEGVQACGNPQAEYDDAELSDTVLATILLG